VTGIDDDAIQAGANLVLTFKNVANAGAGVDAIFDRTLAAATDLSATGFGSVEDSAKTLAKALNDPTQGMSALTRAGVTFTDQQKEQIKTLQASGRTLDAQKLILAEVESQVGGVAAASASSADKMKVAWTKRSSRSAEPCSPSSTSSYRSSSTCSTPWSPRCCRWSSSSRTSPVRCSTPSSPPSSR
jgi:hypothetical protein